MIERRSYGPPQVGTIIPRTYKDRLPVSTHLTTVLPSPAQPSRRPGLYHRPAGHARLVRGAVGGDGGWLGAGSIDYRRQGLGRHWWTNRYWNGQLGTCMVLPEYPTYNGFARLHGPCAPLGVVAWQGFHHRYPRCTPYYTRWCHRPWARSYRWDCYPSYYWSGGVYPRATHYYFDDDDVEVVYGYQESEPAVASSTGAPAVMSYPPGSDAELAPGYLGGRLLTLLEQGHVEYLAGDFERARRFYVRALLDGDLDGRASFYYGLASFALGDGAVAGAGFRRALLSESSLIRRPLDITLLYLDVEVLERQLEVLVAAIDAEPDADSLFALAYLYHALGYPELAHAVLLDLAAADPEDVLVQRLLAEVSPEQAAGADELSWAFASTEVAAPVPE